MREKQKQKQKMEQLHFFDSIIHPLIIIKNQKSINQSIDRSINQTLNPNRSYKLS